MKKLILIFGLAAVVNCYGAGDTPIQNAKITGTSQIASGTFAVKTGVVVTYESGSTLDATAATLKVGTITGATNANVRVDANGTGKFEVDDTITAGTNQDVKIAPNGTGKLDVTAAALKAGTATAGTAPLKFTAGTNLTTPEAGATEFDGNFFYGTNSAAVRQRFSTDASAFAIPSSDIDWSKSASFTKTLGANTTFTFSNATDGKSIVVAVTNTASNYTVTWPTVSWSGGVAPVQSIGAKTDVYCFVKIGSTIYGSAVQANNSLTRSQLPQAVRCRVYNNANISIANATVTALTFNSERSDTDSLHNTSSNTSRITFNTAGTYTLSATVEFAANATGTREVFFYLNGATVIAPDWRNATTGSNPTRIAISAIYDFSAGDYVELSVYQDCGASLNVISSGNYSPEFAAVWNGQ